MVRPKVENPKRKTICLRLTERQLEVLQLYTDVKGFSTEVDALRHIIDGLEGWLKKQDADMEDEPTAPSSAPENVPAMDDQQRVM